MEEYKTSHFESPQSRFKHDMHYYGDSIRKHMMIAAGLLLFLILIDQELLSFYIVFGIAIILASFISAGITNPKSKMSIIFDFAISLVTFCLFEYLALSGFAKSGTFLDLIFIIRQAIAVISLGSLYLTTKTLRGMYYRNKEISES